MPSVCPAVQCQHLALRDHVLSAYIVTAKDVLEPHGTRPQQKTTEQASGEWSGKKKGEEEGKMEEKKRKDSLSSDDKVSMRL